MKILSKTMMLAVLVVLVFVLAWPLLPPLQTEDKVAEAATAADGKVAASTEMRGLWVSSVINLDYPSQPTTSADELRRQADKILDNAKACGLMPFSCRCALVQTRFIHPKFIPGAFT